MVYGTYNELVTGAFVNQLTSLGGLTLYVYPRELVWFVTGSSLFVGKIGTYPENSIDCLMVRKALRGSIPWEFLPSGKQTHFSILMEHISVY